MFILLYMTLKMSFFAKVIRLSLFDDANIQIYSVYRIKDAELFCI